MQGFRRFLLPAFLFASLFTRGWGYYYTENFTVTPSGWTTGLRYGKDTGISTEAHDETITFGTSGASFRGRLATAQTTINSLKGYMIRYDTPYNANQYQPFGYEVTRNYIRLDSHDDTSNPESGRMWSVFSLWLVGYQDGITNGNSGAKYLNQINFMEFYRPKLGSEPDTRPLSFWGLNDNNVGGYNLSAVSRANDIGTVNLANYLQWCYDDYWTRNTYNTGGQVNPYYDNRNIIKIRVTTDGEYAYLYINPNPNGLALNTNNDNSTSSYPNEFLLIAKEPIGFSDNLIAMFGLEGNRSDSESNNLEVANFTIRSVCSSVTSEIAPYEFKAGASTNVYFVIKPVFSSANEAGVGEFTIDMPTGYAWTNQYTNSISVQLVNSTGNVVKSFGKIYGSDSNPSSGSVNITVKEIDSGDKRRLKIRFNSSEVFHPDNGCGTTATNAILVIVSNFAIMPDADASGKSFSIYVNNEKYNDTSWTKVATTGRMKSYAGNAYNMSYFNLKDSDTLTFKSFNDPIASAGISAGITPTSPYPFMYEGDMDQTISYTISAVIATNNNANISKVEIIVPPGFTINSNTLTSLRIASSNILVSNASGNQIIVVDYSKEGKELVAGGGIDTINFKNYTTTNFNTNEVLVEWKSVSYSLLPGTMPVTNVTNSDQKYQTLLVRKKPPNGDGYIAVTPNSVPAYTKNTAISNFYSYFIQNNGEAGNYFKKVLIKLDPLFTNAVFISNTIPSLGTVYSSNSSVWLEVNYGISNRVLSNGLMDVITFSAMDNVPSLTNEILVASNLSYADNGNGDGWVPLSRDSLGWEVYFYTPPAELRTRIILPGDEDGGANPYNRHEYYTDIDYATNIQIEVKNWGEYENDIYFIKIYCPPQITNIVSYNSLIGAALSLTNENGSNVIIAAYTNLGNLKAAYNDPSSGSNDIINLNVLDSVTQQMDISFAVFGKNTTNWAEGSSLEGGNVTMNYIYPPVIADSFVTVPDGFIDAATNMATITYTINNRGRTGNRINQAFIYFPTGIITNVQFNSSLRGAIASYNAGTGVLTLSYTNNFPGQTSDVISMSIWDNVESSRTTFDLLCGVSNDRYLSNYIGITSGETQTVFIMPPPTLYSYSILPTVLYNAKTGITNTNEVVISVSNRGWGSNKLDRVRIDIPPLFANKVVSVSNERTGLTNEPGGPVQLSNGSYIWVLYDQTNASLPAGYIDRIHLQLEVSATNVTNTHWIVWAANNSTNDYSLSLTNNGLMIVGGTNLLSLVDMPHFYVTPGEVLTPSTVNTFTNRIRNGDTPGDGVTSGRNITGVRIGLPYVITGVSNIISSSGGIASTNGNFIIISYPTPITPSSLDTITYKAYDNWTSGETWVYFTMDVDYGDGSGWHTIGVTSGQTNEVYFRNPTVKARAYVTPNQVSQNFPTNSYEFYLENNGESGNNILMAKITAPSFITNITTVTSITKSAFLSVNSNIVILYYTNSVLGSGETDLIRLIGYDNVESTTTNGSWSVMVYNTTNMTNGENAVVVAGKSLDLNIVQPDCRPRVYIEATNSVSLQEKNVIYSTITTNYLKFYVYNLSPSETDLDNSIIKLKIAVPDNGILDTNTIQLTNLMKSNAISVFSNGYIWVDYSASKVLPGEHDEILIRVNDKVTHTETNVTWSAEAAFVSTYENYKQATLYSSDKSLSIYYRMPLPLATVNMNPKQIFQNLPSFVLHITLSNAGSGTSDIDTAWIDLPSELRLGFDIGKISNTVATSTNYDSGSGRITFSYSSPLLVGSKDDIYLYLTNTASASTNLYIASTVRNFVNTNATDGEVNKYFFISTYPTVSVQPNQIDTSTTTNRFTVTLDNMINGNLEIKKAILSFPAEFTNILYISSRIITNTNNILGTITSLTLNYDNEGKKIDSGDYDTITLDLADNVSVGSLTNGIRAYVNDGQGFGFVQTGVRVGGSTNIIFHMPAPQSHCRVSPETIYVTTTTNNLKIWITNEGTGSSAIRFARIWLPLGISNISPSVISSNAGLVDYIVESNLIQIEYTNSSIFAAGKEDLITFDITNMVSTPSNLTILVEVANLTNNPVYYTSYGPIGGYLTLRVDYPPVSAEGYFVNNNKVYIINTNETLVYRVMNRTYGTQLTQAVITMETNIFSNVIVSSLKATSIGYNSTSNQFTLSYDSTGENNIEFGEYDDVSIHFDYSLSNSTFIPVNTKVWLMGTTVTNIDTIASSGNVSYILVTNSPWGNVRGSVFPVVRAVNIKLYYPGTSVAATNADGQIITAASSPGSGIYNIDKVPGGYYDIEFSSKEYRTYRLRNQNIVDNQLNIISIVTMRNAPLMTGINSNQTVDCYEDERSHVAFLPNGIEKRFSVNIYRKPFTDEQKDKVSTENLIKPPTTKDGLYGYLFELDDVDDNSIWGAIITNDAIVYLAYDKADIESRGWSEKDLAIYYWDETKLYPRWIRIGGEVDTVNQWVVAKVNYVHSFYAVMNKEGDGKVKGPIKNVAVRPKVFTPTKDPDGNFGSVRISFELDSSASDGYEVRIYDLRGNLIKTFVKKGSYVQGEIAWDSRDDEGHPVKTGVYIYQVRAGGTTYSGTVIIVR